MILRCSRCVSLRDRQPSGNFCLRRNRSSSALRSPAFPSQVVALNFAYYPQTLLKKALEYRQGRPYSTLGQSDGQCTTPLFENIHRICISEATRYAESIYLRLTAAARKGMKPPFRPPSSVVDLKQKCQAQYEQPGYCSRFDHGRRFNHFPSSEAATTSFL